MYYNIYISFRIYTAIADDVKERLESGALDMGLLLRKDSPLAEKERITPKALAFFPQGNPTIILHRILQAIIPGMEFKISFYG